MEEEKVLAPELEEGAVKEDVNNKPEEQEEESLADSVRVVSPGRLVAKRFFRSRLSMVGLITLIVLFAFSFIGPLFSPWGETQEDQAIPEDIRESYNIYSMYAGVSQDEIDEYGSDKTEVVSSRGYDVYKVAREDMDIYYVDETFEIKDSKGGAPAVYFHRCDAQGNYIEVQTIEYIWDRKPANQLGKIDANHWLGTDELAMDVFTRLMYGGRISLTLGFVVVILETILGVIFGGLAGYFGRWVDQLIMRIVDIFNCVPTFPILLILSAVLDGTNAEGDPIVDPKYRIYYLMVIMTLLGWAGIARVVRGQILYLREQEYMIAAEALGLSVPRKIFRHLLPNILPQLIVQMTLGLGGIILTESTLSYLGIGIPTPNAAWGTMISAAQKPEILQGYPNLWIPAGILIVLAVLAFNFVGDGLRDAFDPKASR